MAHARNPWTLLGLARTQPTGPFAAHAPGAFLQEPLLSWLHTDPGDLPFHAGSCDSDLVLNSSSMDLSCSVPHPESGRVPEVVKTDSDSGAQHPCRSQRINAHPEDEKSCWRGRPGEGDAQSLKHGALQTKHERGSAITQITPIAPERPGSTILTGPSGPFLFCCPSTSATCHPPPSVHSPAHPLTHLSIHSSLHPMLCLTYNTSHLQRYWTVHLEFF